jgi:hypothetical protein
MRAVKENGHEVFVLLSVSDSEPDADDRDSGLEVIEALKRTSRSSSAIPLSGKQVLIFPYSAHYFFKDVPDIESDSEKPEMAVGSASLPHGIHN